MNNKHLQFKHKVTNIINKLLKLLGINYVIVKEKTIYYKYLWYNADKKIDLKKLPGFSGIACRVIEDQTTLLNYDRLYTLWQAVCHIPSSDLPLAEIGTYRGGSAKFIMETLKQNGHENPFYVFDTFEGHAFVDESIDGEHHIGTFADTSYEKVKAYLRSTNVIIYKGDFLKTAGHIEKIKNFGMVHIDVDVYPVTKFCLDFFAGRTIPGSVIIVDDYGFITCQGAKKATDEFIRSNANFKLFHLVTGQALVLKVS
jgi:O-methyltransferase